MFSNTCFLNKVKRLQEIEDKSTNYEGCCEEQASFGLPEWQEQPGWDARQGPCAPWRLTVLSLPIQAPLNVCLFFFFL